MGINLKNNIFKTMKTYLIATLVVLSQANESFLGMNDDSTTAVSDATTNDGDNDSTTIGVDLQNAGHEIGKAGTEVAEGTNDIIHKAGDGIKHGYDCTKEWLDHAFNDAEYSAECKKGATVLLASSLALATVLAM